MAVDTSWTLEPGLILLTVATCGAYATRWHRVRHGPGGVRGAPTVRAVAFGGAIAVLVAALVSPLDVLGEQVFALHMVQHVLLLDVVPILLVLSLTKVLLRPVTRRLQRLEESAGVLAHPAVAVVVYVAVMWGWHVPALYDAALRNPVIHVLEHVCLVSAGALYWWHLLSPIRSRMSKGPFGPVVYMAVTKLLVGFLGIGLTFAPHPLYAFYVDGPRVWGLAPVDDQALAGAVMAIEQSVVMGIALAFLFVRALAESDRADERADRYESVR